MTSRACRALLALVLLLGAGALWTGGARAADAPAAKPAVAVGIGEVNPQIPDFTDTNKLMTFSGRLQNTRTTALKNVVVELRRSLVDARSELGAATGNGSLVYTTQGKPLSTKLAEVAPGTPVDWKLTPTEAELFGTKKPQAGVYAIDVDVVGSDGEFLGGQRTFVVWKPLALGKKARVALLWPVVGQPGLTGRKTPNAAAPIVSDPQAEQQFQPNGRLDKILQDGKQLTVNWVLDPDVLYTANELSGAYFVSPDGSPKTVGADGADARNWYAAAHELFTDPRTQNCWNLPYADPDLTTLSRTDVGRKLLDEALNLKPSATIGKCRQPQTIAWPAGGQADATTLKALQSAGVPDQVTLLASNVVSSWKSAHVSVPQSPNTVVYDTYLSNVFTEDAPPAGQPQLNAAGVLAGQKWLAQTALLAGDYTDRMLVVAPPRDFTPADPLVKAIVAADKLGQADQWVGLDDLGKVLADPKPIAAPSSPLVAKMDTPNLSSNVVTWSSDSQKLYKALHTIMETSHDQDDAVPFRPVATWWRTHPGVDGNDGFAKTVYRTVVDEHALVWIGGQDQALTLSGKSGSVPVTIVNKTNATVHVYLHAHSQQRVKLKVNENQGLQTVTSGQKATVSIHVEGEGNGQEVGLDATLYTCPELTSSCMYYPTDLKYTPTDPVEAAKLKKGYVMIPVKVSRIGVIALGLIIGSGVLLVALIGLRVYRAKRAHHASAQDTMAS